MGCQRIVRLALAGVVGVLSFAGPVRDSGASTTGEVLWSSKLCALTEVGAEGEAKTACLGKKAFVNCAKDASAGKCGTNNNQYWWNCDARKYVTPSYRPCAATEIGARGVAMTSVKERVALRKCLGPVPPFTVSCTKSSTVCDTVMGRKQYFWDCKAYFS